MILHLSEFRATLREKNSSAEEKGARKKGGKGKERRKRGGEVPQAVGIGLRLATDGGIPREPKREKKGKKGKGDGQPSVNFLGRPLHKFLFESQRERKFEKRGGKERREKANPARRTSGEIYGCIPGLLLRTGKKGGSLKKK